MATDMKVIAVTRSETRRGDPMWTLQTVDETLSTSSITCWSDRPGRYLAIECVVRGDGERPDQPLGEHADLVRHRQAAQVSGSYVSATGNALREAGQTYRTGGRLGTVRTSLVEYALVAQRPRTHRLRHPRRPARTRDWTRRSPSRCKVMRRPRALRSHITR